MRPLGAVVLVILGASAAGAQTRVSTSPPTSEQWIWRSGAMSTEEMNALLQELTMIEARQRALEAQLRNLRENDGSPQRIDEVQRLLARTASEFFPRQSALAIVCQTMLASQARSEGYLGLTFDEEIMIPEARVGQTEAEIRFAGTPRIVAVDAGSPAARAGVRVGDEWVALGARRLHGATMSDLDALLTPGARQTLRVRREGRELELDAIVGKREQFPTAACERAVRTLELSPMLERRATEAFTPRIAAAAPTRVTAPVPPSAPPSPRSITFVTTNPVVFGASFRVLDPDVRDFVGFTGEGLLVDKVAAGSPAAAAGLRAFDVITRVNGAVLTTPTALVRLLQEERRTELTVQRKNVVRTVVLAR
jgi:serine protease Do